MDKSGVTYTVEEDGELGAGRSGQLRGRPGPELTLRVGMEDLTPGDLGSGLWDEMCATWLPRSTGGTALVLRAVASHGA